MQETYFRRSRDFWWNLDFLHLMAARWSIAPNAKILDVGCGQGHWGRLLIRVLQPSGAVFLDRDDVGFEYLRRFIAEENKDSNFELKFIHAIAEALPLEANTFDLVTCQTLLMHVSSAERVLAEMVRVCKPGGTVVCVEPSDIANCAILSPLFLDQPRNSIIRHFDFWTAYAAGRKALGRGDMNVGERLPALYRKMNLHDVHVYMSDKALSLTPPYEGEEQQILLGEEIRASSGAQGPWQGIWRAGEVHECFLAGGGTESDFDEYLNDIEYRLSLMSAALAGRSYSKTGGRVLYLASGRKSL